MSISTLVKCVVLAMPFVFLFIDVLSWWLTKVHPSFAWLTIISGVGYTLASCYMWTVSLWQMWIYPYQQKISDENPWLAKPSTLS